MLSKKKIFLISDHKADEKKKKKKKLKGNLKVVPTTLILALILICPLATEMLC